MGHHFLLVEGVNLYANIYDTDQFSVIRGSSFLYKDAITHHPKSICGWSKPVSTGASSGLIPSQTRYSQSHRRIAQKM